MGMINFSVDIVDEGSMIRMHEENIGCHGVEYNAHESISSSSLSRRRFRQSQGVGRRSVLLARSMVRIAQIAPLCRPLAHVQEGRGA
jgi:hypothetical protein